jgi:hypothetical protein
MWKIPYLFEAAVFRSIYVLIKQYCLASSVQSVSNWHYLFVLCYYIQFWLLQSIHYLSILHTVLFCVLCPKLSSKMCPLSVSISHCTVLCHYVHCSFLKSVHCLSIYHTSLFCVTIPTAAFFSLSTVCQYVTMYSSVSLCPMLSSRVRRMSVSTSQCTVLCHYVHSCLLQLVHSLSIINTIVFCVTMFTAGFNSLSTVCQYVTLYSSVSLYPLLSSTVYPLSVNNSYCTAVYHYVNSCFLQSAHCLSISNTVFFCVTMSTAGFYSRSTLCQ